MSVNLSAIQFRHPDLPKLQGLRNRPS